MAKLYDAPQGENGKRLGRGSMSSGGRPENVEVISSVAQKFDVQLLLLCSLPLVGVFKLFTCEILCADPPRSAAITVGSKQEPQSKSLVCKEERGNTVVP